MRGHRFEILGSSSSGNCALLETEETHILIDAGFSAKRLRQMLDHLGTPIERIDGIFITHEHADHIAGLKTLTKQLNTPLFANRKTADAIQAKLDVRANWRIFETGLMFEHGGMKIHPFAIPHDAADPVGYVFEWGEPEMLFNPVHRLAWVTDLGYVPKIVEQRVRDVDTLVIEANYDETLLDTNERRSLSLKQRVRSKQGHLSNTACLEFLEQADTPTWKTVYLGHLSKECNDVQLLQKEAEALMNRKQSFEIKVVDPRVSVLERTEMKKEALHV